MRNIHHRTITAVCAVQFLCTGITNAQFTLEHVYTAGSTMMSVPQSDNKQPLMVRLEAAGDKYVIIDRQSKTVSLFNLDHTPFRTISFAATTDVNPAMNMYGILYISQHLFDLDDEVEFMYTDIYYTGSTMFCATQVVDEDGSLLFSSAVGYPSIKANFHQQQYPIYNTGEGTKLILSTITGDAHIYSLAGHLSTAINPDRSLDALGARAYPNPTDGMVALPYDLGADESEAYLVVTDAGGREIHRARVIPGSRYLMVDMRAWDSGTFHYRTISASRTSEARPIVHIEN